MFAEEKNATLLANIVHACDFSEFAFSSQDYQRRDCGGLT